MFTSCATLDLKCGVHSSSGKERITMTVDQLISMAQNRLVILNEQKNQAIAVGDVIRISQLDTEIFQTETTLAQLKTLPHSG
jgi:hypothetical protein